LADAQQVCDTLGIPLKTVNFSAEYWDEVFEVFLSEFKVGRTPNPISSVTSMLNLMRF
jgi:tRNA-specific 2-thiouridylase